MKKLTQTEVRLALKSLGMTFRAQNGEFRVAFNEPDNEPAAYYTDDLADALATGKAMYQHRKGKM